MKRQTKGGEEMSLEAIEGAVVVEGVRLIIQLDSVGFVNLLPNKTL